MSSASWVTLPNLGTFVTNYNFNLHPITLTYTSDFGATINVLNGSLPSGLTWSIVSNTIKIQGESTGVTVTANNEITFRITDPDGTIADRSFYITITPVPVTPDWSAQNTFLGYASLGVTSTYTVVAANSTKTPIQYQLISGIPNMSINAVTGVITYTPSLSLANGASQYYQSMNVKIRSLIGSQYSDFIATIIVVSTNYPPQWITPSGSVGTYIMNTFVEVDLFAYDPNGNGLVYTLTSNQQNFPFTVSTTGFLYGRVPISNANVDYNFVVTASGQTGSTSQSFVINAVIDTIDSSLTWNNENTILGPFTDGQLTDIDVSASTTRANTFVYHSFSGGTLPPNMTLNMQQGHISGFLEFHAIPKTYYFEITATDGIQTLVRKYQVTVMRGTYDMFVDVSIPIMSDTKQAVASTKQSMIRSVDDVPYHAALTDNVPVTMNLISGLSYANEKPDLIFDTGNLYLHSTILEFGSSAYSNINVVGDTIFYRNIVDPENGAQYPANTAGYHAESLQNMRTALATSFVNNGNGTNANLIPELNFATTGIGSVKQTNSGNNYYSSPTLVVNGTGNGAVLTTNITVNSANVISSGSGWTINQVFDFIIDEDHTITMQAISVDNMGGLSNVTILDGSSFTSFPYDSKTVMVGNAIAEMTFDLGINMINVSVGGSGYSSNSTITTNGQEFLPSWQTTWFPYIPICTVDYAAVYNTNSMVTSDTLSILDSLDWRVRFLTLDIQGKRWTGNTMFDGMDCTFDGGETRFVEWIEPQNVTFDLNETTFDHKGTVFDQNPVFVSTVLKMYGDTIIDHEKTIFDLYRTIFDEAGPSFESITRVRKLYRLISQGVNNNNLTF